MSKCSGPDSGGTGKGDSHVEGRRSEGVRGNGKMKVVTEIWRGEAANGLKW